MKKRDYKGYRKSYLGVSEQLFYELNATAY